MPSVWPHLGAQRRRRAALALSRYLSETWAQRMMRDQLAQGTHQCMATSATSDHEARLSPCSYASFYFLTDTIPSPHKVLDRNPAELLFSPHLDAHGILRRVRRLITPT